MPEDRSKRGDVDRERISLTARHEVRYWTQALGCSEHDLRVAVQHVGDRAADVREALGVG